MALYLTTLMRMASPKSVSIILSGPHLPASGRMAEVALAVEMLLVTGGLKIPAFRRYRAQ
jgi:hypothetical protein